MHKNAKVGTKGFQILSKPSENCTKTFKSLPKWRNFAKTGDNGWRLTKAGSGVMQLRAGGAQRDQMMKDE